MNHNIYQAKVGLTDGGPFNQHVVASVQYEEDGALSWLSCVEVEGFPNFYLSEDDIFDRLAAEGDEAFLRRLEDELAISEFEGVPLGEYDDILDAMAKGPEKPGARLIRYLIALIRLDMGESLALAGLADGRPVEEADIPETDLDEDQRERV